MIRAAEPEFAVGQCIRHRRYGYRGVIAGFDLRCRASNDWYTANRSQPAKDQPWYHVLVHGAVHTTYAAESNLEVDPEPKPVDNPLVQEVFQRFAKGRHIPKDKD